eukprot:TRINITY_DN8022_c0_g3_i11.p5 TRINITY_DN8022_c0_g3~~TRINITY_DN8022_c0_g3_i11.p5  ORF type:complete len:150 (+),score=21.38 TRINITY_DN8022_c0_g3_i11:108-557(+)
MGYVASVMLLTCSAFCAGLGFYLGRNGVDKKKFVRKYGDKKNQKKCLQVVTKFVFQSEDDRDQFFKWWNQLAAFVAESEPGCFSYQASLSNKDPLRAIVFARYIDKEYIAKVHQQSEAYLKFKDRVDTANMIMETETSSYVEMDMGFMH